MSVRMDEAEVRAFLEAGHTGILTTLRRDGWPVTTPTWYVALDGCVFWRTPTSAKKLRRLQRDDRACFLVEAGRAWADLQAVVLLGRVTFVEDETEHARITAAIETKYEAFRTQRAALPEDIEQHYYAAPRPVMQLRPDEKVLTWDNHKLPATT